MEYSLRPPALNPTRQLNARMTRLANRADRCDMRRLGQCAGPRSVSSSVLFAVANYSPRGPDLGACAKAVSTWLDLDARSSRRTPTNRSGYRFKRSAVIMIKFRQDDLAPVAPDVYPKQQSPC
jgi:hypothetical protein